MSSLSTDAAAIRRTFANVAATVATPTQPLSQSLSNSNTKTAPTNGKQPKTSSAPENVRISPAIPKKLSPLAVKAPQPAKPESTASPNILVQSPGASVEEHPRLNGPLPSIISDENSTQLSSSDSSAKPASLDGKSVASATTFALDEKESLRPDDSASVKATEDEDLYSPPGSAAVGSRMGSETGARAFRDQLQEITSMGPSRPSLPASRPDSSSNPAENLLYNPSALPIPGQVAAFVQPSSDVLGKPADFPPDPKLLEAINSPRDRIWVLKLEQDIIDFVKDSKEPFVDLPQCNSFYRMLAHKLADYYLLGHAVDGTVTAVRLYRTPTCRIAPPLTALTNPSTASNTPPPQAPQVKILRRGGEAPPMSKTASEAGDSDSEKNKAPLTREEREQRYEQARLRIMGSAKPEADVPGLKEKDESRSSSVAGKKKPKKQRTNSEDGFEARSAYSTYQPPSSYNQSATPENGGAATYYPTYPENGPGMYNGGGSFTPQTYSAVYGQTLPSQAPYPWLQQGFSGYGDSGGPQWDQNHKNGNDLATDFQQSMSLHSPNIHGPMSPQTQGAPYGFAQQQQQAQPPPSYTAGTAYQPNYQMPGGYQQYGASDRPASSASHGNQYGYYGMGSHQMPGQYMNYGNGAMNNAFQRASFNPQSQAFIPNYQGAGAPQHFMGGVGANAGGYASYSGPHTLQRQGSTQSQNSSYGGQRPNNDNANMRGASSGMTHPLPQPVFSPSIPMPYPSSQKQAQAQAQTMPARSTSSNGTTDRSVGPQAGPSASTIAKWGTPASLPAKPPPPANDSFNISQLAGQRAPAFNSAAAARLPGMGGAGHHGLPSMAGMRGGAAGQGPRGGQ